MRKALAALTACLTLFGVPAGALAQSAGDEQYVDPFGGGGGQGGETPQEPAPQEQPAPSEPAPVEPAPSEPAPVAPAAPAEPAPVVPEGGNGEASGAGTVAPEASGPTLPRTGAPTLALLLGGLALTGAGAVLRRRL